MSYVTRSDLAEMIPVSAELAADISAMDGLLDLARKELAASAEIAWRELGLNAEYGWGTRHHPDRNDWWHATRPDRIRRNILANLPPGRPGRFQKASPAATGDTTPTNTP